MFVDPMYPPPPMEAPGPPSVSISTLLSIVQPLLDIIAALLPPSDGGVASNNFAIPDGVDRETKRYD